MNEIFPYAELAACPCQSIFCAPKAPRRLTLADHSKACQTAEYVQKRLSAADVAAGVDTRHTARLAVSEDF